MKNAMKIVGIFVVSLVAVSTLHAAEATLSLDIASAYVFRGARLNDGLVMQPGLEVGGLGGLRIGVWGNYDIDDYDDSLAGDQFSEIDIYGSYAIPLECMDLSVGYMEYTFPSAGGDADREISANVGGTLAGIDLGAGVFYGIDGGLDESLYVELFAGKSLNLTDDLGLDLGSALGYASPDDGADGFSHFTLSLGVNYASFSAGITYIGQIDDDVLPDVADGGGYDSDVVGTIGTSITF